MCRRPPEIAASHTKVWFANRFVLIGDFINQWQTRQFIGQKCKVVHWPTEPSETVELNLLIQETILSWAHGSDHMQFFRRFDPYPVRFKPYLGSSASSLMPKVVY